MSLVRVEVHVRIMMTYTVFILSIIFVISFVGLLQNPRLFVAGGLRVLEIFIVGEEVHVFTI